MRPEQRTALVIATVRRRHRASRDFDSAVEADGFRTIRSLVMEFIDKLESGEITTEDLRQMNAIS